MIKLSSNKLVYPLITIALFVVLMYATNFMFREKYISTHELQNVQVESFDDKITHDVNMPINTNHTCKNMCGPPNRCAITGEQCLSDLDCYGCQDEKAMGTDPKNKKPFLVRQDRIPGNNDAGKMSFLAPLYSPLTKDSSFFAGKILQQPESSQSKPPQSFVGFDTWSAKSIEMKNIYNMTHQPPGDTPYLLKYEPRYSATGIFLNESPYAANATLPI